MFRHVVMFTWKPEATQEQKQAVPRELRKLPGQIEEMRGYQVGPDAGINPGNYDFVVVADFAGKDAYLAYRDNPVHRTTVERYITPIAATRAAVQYEIED